jgi:hypothetical protein
MSGGTGTFSLTAKVTSEDNLIATASQPFTVTGSSSGGFLVGATTNPQGYGATANTWIAGCRQLNAYLSGVSSWPPPTGVTPIYMATTRTKIYLQEGSWPTSLSPEITQLAAVGCKFTVCVRPIRAGQPTYTLDPSGSYGDATTLAEKTNLFNYLTMLNNAGISYDVVPWQECNLRDNLTPNNPWFRDASDNFSPTEYHNWCDFYCPTIITAGASITYDPGTTSGNNNSQANAVLYYPPNANVTGSGYTISKIIVDWYGDDYKAGVDPSVPGAGQTVSLVGLADQLGIPFGIGEWANSADGHVIDSTTTPTAGDPATYPHWMAYTQRLHDIIQGRLNVSKPMCQVMYYSGSQGGPNTITGPDDYQLDTGTIVSPSTGLTYNVVGIPGIYKLGNMNTQG